MKIGSHNLGSKHLVLFVCGKCFANLSFLTFVTRKSRGFVNYIMNLCCVDFVKYVKEGKSVGAF